MKAFVLFVVCVVLMIPAAVFGATNDPTALHDRGNQKLIGSLNVSNTVTTDTLSSNHINSYTATIREGVEVNSNNLYTFEYIYANANPVSDRQELAHDIADVFGTDIYNAYEMIDRGESGNFTTPTGGTANWRTKYNYRNCRAGKYIKQMINNNETGLSISKSKKGISTHDIFADIIQTGGIHARFIESDSIKTNNVSLRSGNKFIAKVHRLSNYVVVDFELLKSTMGGMVHANDPIEYVNSNNQDIWFGGYYTYEITGNKIYFYFNTTDSIHGYCNEPGITPADITGAYQSKGDAVCQRFENVKEDKNVFCTNNYNWDFYEFGLRGDGKLILCTSINTSFTFSPDP